MSCSFVILLGVTLWLTTTGINAHLCETPEEELISIFNLGNNIIFQDSSKNFYRIDRTEIVIDENETFPLIEKTMKNDFEMTRILENKFDISQSVFGFTAINEYIGICNETTDQNERKECEEVDSDFNSYYTCFFGYKGDQKKQEIEAFKYSYSKLIEFKSDSLKKRILEICDFTAFKVNPEMEKLAINGTINGTRVNLIGGIQFYDSTFDIRLNYTFLNRQILISGSEKPEIINVFFSYETLVLKDANDNPVLEVNHNKDTVEVTKFMYAFRYNQNYGVLGCPLGCTLDTKLTKIHFMNGKQITTSPFDKSLKELARCPKIKEWRPNEFCSQTSFLSIFNMGKDIFFQNPGKIWRYISTGANNFGRTDFPDKIQSIRFDSDTIEFLEKYFDTSRPLLGFAIKHDLQDMCISSDKSNYIKECEQHFKKYNQLPYYRSCIYGQQFEFNGKQMQYKEIIEAFYYTPLGLELFEDKDIRLKTQKFCKQIGTAIDTIQTKYKLIGILNQLFTSPEVTNYLYVVFKNIDTNENSLYSTSIQTNFKFDSNSDLKLKFISNTEETITSMIYLWWQNIVIELAQNASDKPLFHTMTQMKSQSTTTTSQFSDSLYNLFNCPFTQSYSLVNQETQELCKDFTGIYSLFQLHEKVYFQKGRHFYRALIDRRHFIYDKYFTALMNDNFDTRYRVTGYAYLFDFNEEIIRVNLVGRTKPEIGKHLGPKMFRAFSTSYSSLSPLEAINDAKKMKYTNITFGLTDPILRNTIFKAMLYWNVTKFQLHQGPLVIKPNSSLVDIFMVLNHTDLYYARGKQETLEFPFLAKMVSPPHHWTDNFITLSEYQVKSPFSDIWGMFGTEEHIFMAAWPPTNQPRGDVPLIYRVWEYKPGVNRSYFLLPHQKHENWFFNEFFDCKKGLETSSESGGSGLFVVLIILIIILLLMGCVVGLLFWDYMRSEKSTKSSGGVSTGGVPHKLSSKTGGQQNMSSNQPIKQSSGPSSGQPSGPSNSKMQLKTMSSTETARSDISGSKSPQKGSTSAKTISGPKNDEKSESEKLVEEPTVRSD